MIFNRSKYIFSICMLLFVCISCVNKVELNEDQPIKQVELTKISKTPLFNDSLTFQYADLRGLDQGVLQVFSYPLMDLTLIKIDSSISFRGISQSGDGPDQFLNGFIESLVLPNGDICVLQQSDDSRLLFFNKEGRFLKNINLNRLMPDYFGAPFESSFQCRLDKNSNSIYLFYAATSKNFHKSEKEYYKGFSIVELQLSFEDYSFKNVKLVAPFGIFDELNILLSDNKKTWKTPTPYFTVTNDRQYVKYDFSEKLYEFDKDWNMVNSISLKFKNEGLNYSESFEFEDDTEKRLYEEAKLKYCNASLYFMDHYKDNIFLIHNKPIKEENVPKSINDRRLHLITEKVLHVVNLKTNDQYSIVLPANISPNRLKVISDYEIYFISNLKAEDEFYLYKYNYQLKP